MTSAGGADRDRSDGIRWLLNTWREDLAVHGTPTEPGFHAVAIYRFGVWSLRQRGVARWITSKAYVLANLFVRNIYGVELPRRAEIGRRLRLPHPMGVVVHPQTQIGDECMIRQNVTIGQYNYGRERRPPYAPRLGNGVWVGAGAVIVGGITIGDNARIGPNAVVMSDVPPGGFVFARASGVAGPLLGDGEERRGDGPVAMADDSNIEKGSAEAGTTVGPEAGDLIALLYELAEPEEPIDPNTPLISTGIIDSFDITALLTAIEDRFGVTIDPDEVDVAQFDTPSQMIARISSDLR